MPRALPSPASALFLLHHMASRTLHAGIGSALVAAALAACSDSPPDSEPSEDVGADVADSTDGGDANADATVDASSDATDASPADIADTADVADAGTPPSATFLYDPFGDRVTVLPDDALTVPDATSATGLRIRIDERLPWFAAQTGLARDGLAGLDGMDGWGVNAAIALVFDAPVGEVPSGWPSSVESDDLRLVALDEAGPRRVPYEARHTDDGSLLLIPMQPLAPRTRHVVVGTRAVLAADGGEIAPGPVVAALLRGEADGQLAPMNARYAELLDTTGLSADEVAFAVVFTTQDPTSFSRAVAADIAEREYSWDGQPECTSSGDGADAVLHCEGAFEAWSWRDEEGDLGGGDPVRQYRLRVSAWLPAGPGPHPTVLFGHGLAHGREVGGGMARICNPLGIAVVAIDAVAHGEHPDAPDDDAMVLFDFFALSLNPLTHLPRRLRDNFRQSTWDKLQLLRLLELHPDVDGDDVPDVDLDRMAYVGESFGGIMAIELLALTDRFEAAALQLAGGRVTSIISDARRFQVFSLIAGGGQDPSDVQRFYPVIQAVVDPGDASTWAPHVLSDRLPEIGGAPPHLLVQLVIDDDTIPDPSSDSLVRALGIPQVPPVIRAVPMAPETGDAPVSGNAGDGARTEGFFQFDRIRRNPAADIEPATHDFMPSSEEGQYQVREFLRAWVAGDLPVIDDPFAALATPELEP
ncbi:MAG: hypothetical protein H6697_03245 [Myxococcales bacterium]|nr:hypothetical protein [Myxococcales bacterium]